MSGVPPPAAASVQRSVRFSASALQHPSSTGVVSLPRSSAPRHRRADRHLWYSLGAGRFRRSATNDVHPVLCSLPANFNAMDPVHWDAMRQYLQGRLQYHLHVQLTMDRDVNSSATSHAPIAEYSEQLSIGQTLWFRIRLGQRSRQDTSRIAEDLQPPDEEGCVEIGIVLFKTPLGSRWESQVSRRWSIAAASQSLSAAHPHDPLCLVVDLNDDSFRSYDPTDWSQDRRRSSPAYVKLATSGAHWPDSACKRFAQEIDQVVAKQYHRLSIAYQHNDEQARRVGIHVPVDVAAPHFPPLNRAAMRNPKARRLLFAAHCESGGDRSAYAVLSYLLSRCYPAVHPTAAFQLVESARFYTPNAHQANRWELNIHGWPTLQKQFAQRDATEMQNSMERAALMLNQGAGATKQAAAAAAKPPAVRASGHLSASALSRPKLNGPPRAAVSAAAAAAAAHGNAAPPWTGLQSAAPASSSQSALRTHVGCPGVPASQTPLSPRAAEPSSAAVLPAASASVASAALPVCLSSSVPAAMSDACVDVASIEAAVNREYELSLQDMDAEEQASLAHQATAVPDPSASLLTSRKLAPSLSAELDPTGLSVQYDLVDTPDDGSCLFHCFKHACDPLNDVNRQRSLCSEKAANYNRPGVSKDVILIALSERSQHRLVCSVAEYQDSVMQPNFWGGYPELLLLSDAWGVAVQLMSRNQAVVFEQLINSTGRPDDEVPRIFLYHSGTHYGVFGTLAMRDGAASRVDGLERWQFQFSDKSETGRCHLRFLELAQKRARSEHAKAETEKASNRAAAKEDALARDHDLALSLALGAISQSDWSALSPDQISSVRFAQCQLERILKESQRMPQPQSDGAAGAGAGAAAATNPPVSVASAAAAQSSSQASAPASAAPALPSAATASASAVPAASVPSVSAAVSAGPTLLDLNDEAVRLLDRSNSEIATLVQRLNHVLLPPSFLSSMTDEVTSLKQQLDQAAHGTNISVLGVSKSGKSSTLNDLNRMYMVEPKRYEVGHDGPSDEAKLRAPQPALRKDSPLYNAALLLSEDASVKREVRRELSVEEQEFLRSVTDTSVPAIDWRECTQESSDWENLEDVLPTLERPSNDADAIAHPYPSVFPVRMQSGDSSTSVDTFQRFRRPNYDSALDGRDRLSKVSLTLHMQPIAEVRAAFELMQHVREHGSLPEKPLPLATLIIPEDHDEQDGQQALFQMGLGLIGASATMKMEQFFDERDQIRLVLAPGFHTLLEYDRIVLSGAQRSLRIDLHWLLLQQTDYLCGNRWSAFARADQVVPMRTLEDGGALGDFAGTTSADPYKTATLHRNLSDSAGIVLISDGKSNITDELASKALEEALFAWFMRIYRESPSRSVEEAEVAFARGYKLAIVVRWTKSVLTQGAKKPVACTDEIAGGMVKSQYDSLRRILTKVCDKGRSSDEAVELQYMCEAFLPRFSNIGDDCKVLRSNKPTGLKLGTYGSVTWMVLHAREYPTDPIRSNVALLHSWAHTLLVSGHLSPLRSRVSDGADLLQRRFDFLTQLTQLAHLNASSKKHIHMHVTSAAVSKPLQKLKAFAEPSTGPWYSEVVEHTESLLQRDLQLQFDVIRLTEVSKLKAEALRKHADHNEIMQYIEAIACPKMTAAAAAATASSSSISPTPSPAASPAASSSAARPSGASSSKRNEAAQLRKRVIASLSRHLFSDVVSHFRDAEKSLRYLFESLQSNAVGQDGEIMQKLLDEAADLFGLTEPTQLSDVLGVHKPAVTRATARDDQKHAEAMRDAARHNAAADGVQSMDLDSGDNSGPVDAAAAASSSSAAASPSVAASPVADADLLESDSDTDSEADEPSASGQVHDLSGPQLLRLLQGLVACFNGGLRIRLLQNLQSAFRAAYLKFLPPVQMTQLLDSTISRHTDKLLTRMTHMRSLSSKPSSRSAPKGSPHLLTEDAILRVVLECDTDIRTSLRTSLQKKVAQLLEDLYEHTLPQLSDEHRTLYNHYVECLRTEGFTPQQVQLMNASIQKVKVAHQCLCHFVDHGTFKADQSSSSAVSLGDGIAASTTKSVWQFSDVAKLMAYLQYDAPDGNAFKNKPDVSRLSRIGSVLSPARSGGSLSRKLQEMCRLFRGDYSEFCRFFSNSENLYRFHKGRPQLQDVTHTEHAQAYIIRLLQEHMKTEVAQQLLDEVAPPLAEAGWWRVAAWDTWIIDKTRSHVPRVEQFLAFKGFYMRQLKKYRKSQKELRAEFGNITRRFESFQAAVDGSSCNHNETEAQTEASSMDGCMATDGASGGTVAAPKRERKQVTHYQPSLPPSSSSAASSVPLRSPKAVRDAKGTKRKMSVSTGAPAAAAAAAAAEPPTPSDEPSAEELSEEDMSDSAWEPPPDDNHAAGEPHTRTARSTRIHSAAAPAQATHTTPATQSAEAAVPAGSSAATEVKRKKQRIGLDDAE